MKLAVFCSIVFASLLNLSCRQNVESSPNSSNSSYENLVDVTRPTPTPEKFEKISVIDAMNDDEAALLEFQDYKLEKVTVRKTGEDDNPKADIFDAVLSKNGKKIARFEGTYNPLGNLMSFGLYPFLGESGKQLWVSDRTGSKDGNDWIVSLSPKYEVIFDGNNYKWWRNSGFVDVEKDGILELLVVKEFDLSLGVARIHDPFAEVVFKYDSKIHKYLPASHILTGFTLDGIDERVEKYKQSAQKELKELLEIMLTYIYAGKENDAWKLFDENFLPGETYPVNVRDKEQTMKRIKNSLNKDPIYRFIKADLKNEN